MKTIFNWLTNATFFLTTTLCATLAGADTAQDTWVLEKDEDNIRVYTRVVEGSEFVAIRASAVMTTSSDAVEAALGDGEGCASWRNMCKASRVLEVVSEDERLIHMVLDLPWPLSDRDVVMRSKTFINPEANQAVVTLNSDSSAYPAQKQVRAECNGQFIIRVLSETEVEVTYDMHADLGGNVSADLVKSRQLSGTHEEMAALRKLVEG